MTDLCLLSVAFGDPRYLQQLDRLEESIELYHPESTFYSWRNDYPPGAKSHEVSAYGFKVWAVKYARQQGFKKIIWFDPAVYLVNRLDPYFELVKDYGVVAAEDDNLLCNYCHDKIYEHFGVTREMSSAGNQHLLGGSIYCFDFNLPLCNEIFDKWEMAESAGVFHYARNDESCLSLALYTSGSKPTPYSLAMYNNVPNPVVRKLHFK